jgi:hypothetical protein
MIWDSRVVYDTVLVPGTTISMYSIILKQEFSTTGRLVVESGVDDVGEACARFSCR